MAGDTKSGALGAWETPVYNLHGALEQALFCCLYVEGNDRSGHVSFPPTDPPVRVRLSHPDAWSPVSAAPGLDPTCSSLSAPPQRLSGPMDSSSFHAGFVGKHLPLGGAFLSWPTPPSALGPWTPHPLTDMPHEQHPHRCSLLLRTLGSLYPPGEGGGGSGCSPSQPLSTQ